MADPEVIRRRLRELSRRVAALRTIGNGDKEAFVTDLAVQAQAERHLQIALQNVIDIALHIVAADTDDTPDDYGSALTGLANIDVLPSELAARLKLAAGLRNVLVHGYLDVDPARIWGHLSRLDDLVSFAIHVEGYLPEE